FRRSHSSPSIFVDSRAPSSSAIDLQPIARPPPTALSFMKLAAGYVVLYVYTARHKSFEGHTTSSPVVDGLYLTVVSLCTIGYGDLVQGTRAAKLFACAFVLVGFGFINVVLSGLLAHALDWQEEALLAAVDAGDRRAIGCTLFLVDVRKRQMRVRIKVALALAVVVASIAFGAATTRALEGLCWVDSFYLAVASVTTVGYGKGIIDMLSSIPSVADSRPYRRDCSQPDKNQARSERPRSPTALFVAGSDSLRLRFLRSGRRGREKTEEKIAEEEGVTALTRSYRVSA
ncbi:two-pore potassium channel 3-like, partial [Curcuma longa]|uniref:two-pore potassium channel 3-like n=1 Tax=Curcuma longa TaxID=136217 RepID=UPI003D9ED823